MRRLLSPSFSGTTWSISSVTRAQDYDGRYSIIITDTLTSPTTYFPFTRPEIGLQVAGHGGANVYFKDYGVKLGERRAKGDDSRSNNKFFHSPRMRGEWKNL